MPSSRRTFSPSGAAAAILEPWAETLARCKSQPAVLSASGAVLRTIDEIEIEAGGLMGSLAEIPQGAVVAVQIGNDPAWPAVLIGLLRAGLRVLPLASGVKPPAFAGWLIGEGSAGVQSLGDVASGELPPRTSGELPPEAILLKLTSGTTGPPRGICFSAKALAADCTQICSTMGLTMSDVNFGVIPLAHSYGFSNLLLPLVLRGIRVVLSNDFLPRAVANGIAASQSTVFPGTPVLFQHLANAEIDRPPSLRLCISAGAPLTREVWSAFYRRWGLAIHTFYGASECGGIAFSRDGEMDSEGAVGEPMQGVEVQPLDGDAGGRIAVRSAAVGMRYFPDEDAAVLDGGRFIPSDLVKFTARGLIVEGRASDLINVAGRKLNPAEVEAALAGVPGLSALVVFGVESRLRGEEAVACVVGEGISREEILRYARERLPAWQVPKDVWLIARLPTDERGKVSRRLLAEQYLAGRDAQG